MYYLLRGNSMLLLDGTLKDGVICKKEGGLFKSKWVPILSTVQLEKLGLLEKAQRYLKSGDEVGLFSDAKIMSCAYRPGPNPEGDVLDIVQLTGEWMKSSGVGDILGLRDLAGEPQSVAERMNAYSLNLRIGRFIKEAEYQLMIAGPELSPEKFNEVMINTLQKSGLPKEIGWQVKHKAWRR
jgi:hypothetical protein